MADHRPVYSRRLSRTPGDIGGIPDDDRQLILGLRSVMEKHRGKVDRLKENLEDREDDLAEEARRRKEAEDRLQARLVDMYPEATEVNDELQQRLPRARRRGRSVDPPTGGASRESPHDDQGEARSSQTRDAQTNSSPVGKQHDAPSPVKSKDRDFGHRRHREHRRRSWDSDVSYTDDSYIDYGSRRHRNRSYYAPAPGAYPPYYPGYSFPHPFPTMVTPPPGYSPVVMLQPTAQSTPNAQFSGAVQLQPATNHAHHRSLPNSLPVGTETNRSMPVYGGENVNVEIRRHSNPDLANNKEKQSLDPKSVTVIGNAPSTAGDAGAIDGSSGPNAGSEYVRQIGSLTTELDAAKDLNGKLSTQLSDTERELDTLKLSQKTRDCQLEEECASKAAVLVEEIYRAQRQRDSAMTSRIRVANEERDEAIARWQEATKEYGMSEGSQQDGVHRDVADLLSDLNEAESSQEIRDRASSILNRINETRQRRTEIVSEEMRAVLDERDQLLLKCAQLKHELTRTHAAGQTSGQTSPNYARQLEDFKTKYQATKRERDMALARNRKLEEELDNVKIYYSLHKSLSQEASLRDQFNNTLSNVEAQIKVRDGMMSDTQTENNRLFSQLKSLMARNQQLEADLTKAKNAQQMALEDKKRQERTVAVLRRKITDLASRDE